MQLRKVPPPTLRVAKLHRPAFVGDARSAQVAYSPLPPEGSGVCVVKVDDLWITCENGPWAVAYRLVLQRTRLVIGELRVYPRPRRPPWSTTRDLQGIHAWAPLGGLTASVVHGIAPGRDANAGRLILRTFRESSNPQKRFIWDYLFAVGVQSEAARLPDTAHRKGGPPGKGIAFYRSVAKVYLNARERPVQAVAKAHGLPHSQARDAVYRARNDYQLLPPTSRGKAGGADLTVLKRMVTKSPRQRKRA